MKKYGSGLVQKLLAVLVIWSVLVVWQGIVQVELNLSLNIPEDYLQRLVEAIVISLVYDWVKSALRLVKRPGS